MYDSTLDEEREEASETAVAPRYQSCIPREESESLLSTGRRLSQVDRTNAQDEVSSGFHGRLPGEDLLVRVLCRCCGWLQVQRELLQSTV
jgi:hypothetical protein